MSTDPPPLLNRPTVMVGYPLAASLDLTDNQDKTTSNHTT